MWLVTFGLVGKEMVHFRCCPVVSTDNKAMVVHVQDEVLALLVEGGGGGKEREREREREREGRRGKREEILSKLRK